MAVKKYHVTVDDLDNIRWYKDAKCKVLHRTDGPAVEYADGSKLWLQDGKYHRDDGPAIDRADGHKEWWQNGQRHRIDGPAIDRADGHKEWWQNGQRHRIDGPAIERLDGDKEWYIDGARMTEVEFLAATQPVVEMTVAEVEKLLGKRVKIVKRDHLLLDAQMCAIIST